MPALTIIVPVYNKERYLDGCIASILNQTFKDFELILVNDGSTDGSLNKCQQYKENDSRIVIIDQHNAGVSAARNAGLTRAAGGYVGFVDGDDFIDADMFELLVRNADTFDADISGCRLRTVFPYKTISPSESRGPRVLNYNEGLSLCLKGQLDMTANNKIYKTKLAQQIKFEGRINEDILFICRAFSAAKQTVFENVVKYNYIVRENSASMSKFNLKYMEIASVSSKLVELMHERNKMCLPEAQALDLSANISLLNLLVLSKKECYYSQYSEVVSNLQKYKSSINQILTVRKKHKYALKLFFFSPMLYKWTMYLYCVLTKSEVIKRTA